MVTPTYYVYFTSATIVTSAILFQGFNGTPTSIITVVMGFLVICSGVVLLQLSKSAKDVPDTATFKGDLDQVRTIAEQEEPESEPKADAIRGTAAIIRRISQSRQKMEANEARRVHEERRLDAMEPIGENEQVEWDGLRRRKTTLDSSSSLSRRNTRHPPLGMTHFPDDEEEADIPRPPSSDIHGGGGLFHGSLFNSFRRNHAGHRNDSLPAHSRTLHVPKSTSSRTDLPQRPLADIATTPTGKGVETFDTAYHPPTTASTTTGDGSMEMGHVYGLPSGLNRSPSASERGAGKPIMWADGVADRPLTSASKSSHHLAAPSPPPHSNKRQFSFQNVFHRNRGNTATSTTSIADSAPDHHPQYPVRPSSRIGLGSRGNTTPGIKSATEEERLGLVKGDSGIVGGGGLGVEYSDRDDDDDDVDEEDDWDLEGKRRLVPGDSSGSEDERGEKGHLRSGRSGDDHGGGTFL